MLKKTEKEILQKIYEKPSIISLIITAIFFLLVFSSTIFSLGFFINANPIIINFLKLEDHINLLLQNRYFIVLTIFLIGGIITRILENDKNDNQPPYKKILKSLYSNKFAFIFIFICSFADLILFSIFNKTYYNLFYCLIGSFFYFILPLIILRKKEDKIAVNRNKILLISLTIIFIYIPYYIGTELSNNIPNDKIFCNNRIGLIVTKYEKYENLILIREIAKGIVVLDNNGNYKKPKYFLIDKSDIEYTKYVTEEVDLKSIKGKI